jgi:hypothetical protein
MSYESYDRRDEREDLERFRKEQEREYEDYMNREYEEYMNREYEKRMQREDDRSNDADKGHHIKPAEGSGPANGWGADF